MRDSLWEGMQPTSYSGHKVLFLAASQWAGPEAWTKHRDREVNCLLAACWMCEALKGQFAGINRGLA